MKTVLIGFLFIAWSTTLFGQQSVIDSVRVVFDKADKETKMRLAIQLAELNFYSQPDSSVFYSQQALALAKASKNALVEANALETMGFAQGAMGLHSDGLENIMKALTIYESVGNDKGIASANNYLGNIYIGLGQPEKSVTYFRKSLDYFYAISDRSSMARQYGNIGITKRRLGEIDSSLHYLGKSIQLRKELGDSIAVAEMGVYLAKTFTAGNQVDSAGFYLKKSIQVMENNFTSLKFLTIALTDLAKIEQKKGRPEIALIHAKKSEKLASNHRLQGELSEAIHTQAEIYSDLKQWEMAFKSMQRFSTLRDSILSGQNRQKISDIQLSYEKRRQDQQIELLRRENQLETQTRRLWTFTTVAALMVLFLLTIVYRMRVKTVHAYKRNNARLKNLNTALKQQKEVAEKATQAKSLLMQIAVHDLKNPLQSVMGLSQLIQEDAPNSSEIQLMAEKIETSSKRMFDLIAHFLDQNTGDLAGTKSVEQTGLKSIIQEIIDETMPQIERKGQKIYFDSPELSTLADRHLLSEIIQNLISNAVKFTPLDGKIEVMVRKTDIGTLISVTDSGPGLSDNDLENVFRNKTTGSATATGGESSSGTGLLLCHELAKLINAKLSARNNPNGPGATFELLITM